MFQVNLIKVLSKLKEEQDIIRYCETEEETVQNCKNKHKRLLSIVKSIEENIGYCEIAQETVRHFEIRTRNFQAL